jgi:WASH complex subunit 7, N-terminal
MIGAFLPTLVEITNFIKRCNAVCVNIVQQLSAILCEKNSIFEDTSDLPLNSNSKKNKNENENSFLNTHIFSAFKCLGDLLAVLMHFDSVITRNDGLKDSWMAYKTLIGRVRVSPGSFNTTEVEVARLEKLLISVDATLLKGAKLY